MLGKNLIEQLRASCHRPGNESAADPCIPRCRVLQLEPIGIAIAAADESEPACIGHGRRKLPARHDVHMESPLDIGGHVKLAFHQMNNDVRELRAARGLSQADLAQEMKVSRQTINAVETGRYTPSLPLAIALARFFQRPVEEVFHANGSL